MFHPKADWLSILVFQLKIIRDECIDKRPIVYVDESGFAVDAPRDRGHSPKEQRYYGRKDWHARSHVNAIGAITNINMLNVCLFDTYINSDVFYAWLTQELLPNTPSHAVIVLDHVTFDRRKDAQLAMEKQGHTLEFLRIYRRDLDSIEKQRAQATSIRRTFGYTPDELFYSSKL